MQTILCYTGFIYVHICIYTYVGVIIYMVVILILEEPFIVLPINDVNQQYLNTFSPLQHQQKFRFFC